MQGSDRARGDEGVRRSDDALVVHTEVPRESPAAGSALIAEPATSFRGTLSSAGRLPHIPRTHC